MDDLEKTMENVQSSPAERGASGVVADKNPSERAAFGKSQTKRVANPWLNQLQAASVQVEVARTPKAYQPISHSALMGEASPRRAIRAQCLECVCFENARRRIAGCKVFTCRLWKYRPYQELEVNKGERNG